MVTRDDNISDTRVAPDVALAPRRRLLDVALVAVLLGAALLHPLTTLLGRYDWRADLITHFPGPALVVTLTVTALLIRKRPRMAVVVGCLAVVQSLSLWRYASPNPVPPDPRSPQRLRILMANVLVDNQ